MKTLLLVVAATCWLPSLGQKWAKDYDFVNDCVCGTSLVKKAGKYGFVNKEGKVLVPLIYDEASTMNEGYAPVRKGNLWAFVDNLGTVIVEPLYADAAGFHHTEKYVLGRTLIIKDKDCAAKNSIKSFQHCKFITIQLDISGNPKALTDPRA
ncbi:MAG: WG repeat-containing protein [Bacteroidetes bacterium]|nr:MAG: WG repeat-containing protein [Bacteroidota bacterium]